MSDILGGIGSVVEGGLFSRALEPDSGAKLPHPDQPDACKNCGTPLTGAYCHACGQRGHVHRTIGAFLHELVHGALHFEGKFWRTLPLLIFRPGQLTRRYIEGQRARFVSPMALFLFTVFLMFAVFQVAGLSTSSLDLDDPRRVWNTEIALQDVTDNLERAREERDTTARNLEEARAEDPNSALTARLQDELAQADADIANLEAGQEQLRDIASEIEGGIEPSQSLPESMVQVETEESEMTGVDFLDEGLLAKWNENPGLMLYKLQANAYKFSWLLIPISIPFVWLLFFWKRRFKAYDHAIFITYSLSFVTLLFIILSVLGVAGFGQAAWLLPMFVIPPIHLYKQLRHAYELSRFSAFWRLMVLSIFIWIVIILFVQLLLMLGAY
ncbi:DUF3667 domain-containing protein [Aurantiacibacter sediminis]|uniref:DUF3667 domain-containing protein n=1 Tax=Aurantiacibacter sediminis TaxID=2793064 RepID=A0ABS0N012_9SPHN|nr:DUF3667 domain-containing protein [Aurantiacibacter sediminis]MBH5321072.1 DUF3667 domain-containing protein [Aurantiacibacter sediminis]